MRHIILHIETATKVCSVAVSVNGSEVACKESLCDKFIHAESLTLFIIEVLELANINFKDLSAVSISSGPGSFTGLRIGLSTAKGICFGLQIPLIDVPTLDSLIQIGLNLFQSKNLIAMIDARRMEVYSLIQNQDGKVLKCMSADIVEENSYAEFEPLVCFGDGVEKLKDLWKNRTILIKDGIYCSARGQVPLAHSKYLAKDFVDISNFTPKYIKEFQLVAH